MEVHKQSYDWLLACSVAEKKGMLGLIHQHYEEQLHNSL